ncbi:thioredoxin domain-containing protein, partial [Haematococcus lacustris]
VTELLTDLHVKRIAGNSRAQLQAFLESQPGLAKVVLLSEKPEVGTLYRALSTLLRHQLAFAQVDVSAGSGVAQALGAPEGLPAVMLLKVLPGEEAGEAYSGELKAEPLLTALKQFSDAPPPVAAEGLKELDWEAVMALDAKEDMALLVLQAAALDAIYSILADVKDMVTCGLVMVGPQDADKFGSSVSTMLTDPEALTSSCTQRLLLLPYGPDKADLDEYQVYSGAMEAKALTAWVVDAMPDRTQQVMGAGFQTFLTLAGLPQGGGQEAEGGRGPSVPGSWASIAQAIGSPLPPKVPCVLLLSVVSPDKGKDSQGFRIRAQPYQGAIKYVKLAAWLGAFVDGMLEMAASTDDTGGEADLAVVDEFNLSDIMGEEVEGQEALLSTQDKLRKVEEELQAAAAHAAP